MKTTRRPFIHPFLFALFPVLSLYSHNVEQVTFTSILAPAAVILLSTVLLLGLSLLLLRDRQKAALVTSLFLFLFFSYGHTYSLVGAAAHVMLAKIGIVRPALVQLVLIASLFALPFGLVTLLAAKTRRPLGAVNDVLSIIAVSLVMVCVVPIGYQEFRAAGLRQSSRLPDPVEEDKAASGDRNKLPDIYYIILDGYGSSTTLKQYYDLPNDEFENHLKSKGFYIAAKSCSNYGHSIQSLTSSLNMEYVHELAGPSSGEAVFSRMIQDNAVGRFLKARGYLYIQFSSGFWGPTKYNRYADLNFSGAKFDEFTIMLARTTVAGRFVKLFLINDHRNNILYAFDKLAEVPSYSQPTFTFAHIVLPHPPFTFGPNGERLSKAQLLFDKVAWNEPQRYADQVIFANKKVTALVDSLLARSSVPPIIILQGDHGPYPSWRHDRSRVNEYDEQTVARILTERFRIFNAYHLPDNGERFLYESISPVNSFRLIFSRYYGANLKLLPDESYVSDIAGYGSQPVNITEKVAYK